MLIRIPISFVLQFLSFALLAQTNSDSLSTFRLNELIIHGYKAMNGIGHFSDSQGTILYSGKKTEVLEIDSLQANKAINNTRQLLGRIPGLNIVESETGGFVANGIGIRGLNPLQSSEMNVRQNGYNISGDVYGYNEAYYLPPMEAVQRIEMVKGASSLQFGSHFGGMINYVLKDSPIDKPFEFVTSESVGNLGLINTYNSVGGTIKKLSYFAYAQYRRFDGWRPNSNQNQFSGFARIQFAPTSSLKLGLEYSLLRNKIKMPGGLNDFQYEQNPRESNRARNWVNSPWNIITATIDYSLSNKSSISFKSTFNISSRNLVWFDEPSDELDLPDLITGEYENREVEKKYMKSNSSELRYISRYSVGKIQGQLASGVRTSYAWFKQLEDGVGTNGLDNNFNAVNNEFEEDLIFTTTNVAPFIENTIYFSDHFSVTPGLRLEYLKSTVKGEKEDVDLNTKILVNDSRSRVFLLAGLGLQIDVAKYTSVYANISQAYKPITYSQIIPLGVVSNIDPNMIDSKGYSADLGYRGTFKDMVNFDVSGFYMAYNNRIGLEARPDGSGGFFNYRTNIGNSIHKGIESYVEVNLLEVFDLSEKNNLSVFNSMTYVDAQYTTGDLKGNRVEYAPQMITRVGLVYNVSGFGTTLQYSYQSKAFGDASNVLSSTDGISGIIPSYSVWDCSSSFTLKSYVLKAGINNLFDSRYFTYRTDEYPGPGIIPAIGRSFYIGITAKF